MLNNYRVASANFGFLSALHLVNVIFPLLLYPFLIRILGPEIYGKVLFAQGIAAYLSVMVMFGFQISATREIAIHRDDTTELSRIVSSTLQAKGFIWLSCLVGYTVVIASTPRLAEEPLLYVLAFGQTFTQFLFPDWYFQGTEKMGYITILSFLVRATVLIATLGLVSGPEDYLLVPAISSAGALVAGAAGLVIVCRDGVHLSLQPISRMWRAMKQGAPLFSSNAIVAMCDRGGTIIVGSLLGPTEVAYYSLGEKVVTAISGFYFNFSRAVFPNLANTRNVVLSKQVFRWAAGIGVIGAAFTFFAAPLLVSLLAGEEMSAAVPILQTLSPQILLAGIGPLLLNVIIIEKLNNSLITNALVAGVAYFMAILGVVVFGAVSTKAIAACLIFSLFVRAIHRLYHVVAHGHQRWIF
ncbi:MAG: O-antigen/teichoic acid export membrane protein [Cryomorphaceae bacterium]|jgi:O-antigen/teichoic acid export membrane protein